jgi:hypothetical protein
MSNPLVKLVQISIPILMFKKLQLLKELGFIRSYADLIRITFEQNLDKKWDELVKAYPDKAQAIYD